MALRSSRLSTSAADQALNLHLHPKQWTAFETPATEVLYGGAAGGGKSHLMRVGAIVWCTAIPGLQVYLFRRIRDDLIKNHMEGPKGFRALLAGWEAAGWCSIVEDEIRFWNGSKLYLCHCKDEKDVYKYQGAEIHVLIVDELTHFTETMYRFLRNRVRMVGITLPAQYGGMFPRILCGANPGNIGHLWVKATFVVARRALSIERMPATEGGMLRQYIPARLEDNPSMAEDDPGYEQRLEGLGSETLVRAMRWGDWDIIEGAFFDCWDQRRHVIEPIEIPELWLRFRSGDWGSAKPFSFGWWAVVQEPLKCGNVWLPRGAIVRYREWYGCQPGKPNTGLKLHAEEVGKKLWEKEKDDPKLTYGVLDPAAFAEDGGPSIAERITAGSSGKIYFRGADNARVPRRGAMGGWDQLRSRFVGDVEGRPMIACFSTCLDSIRTIPALQHDPDKPEDVQTDGEDHCFAAGTLVETDRGPVPIQHLPTTGHVLSLGGYRPYRSARLTRRNASLVRLTFSNEVVVYCTKDHKFLVDLNEWRYASDLVGRSILCVQPSSAQRFKNSMASATTSAADIFSGKAVAFISGFGSIITVLFRNIITFTTKTIIGQTMLPTTSNALPCQSIWAIDTAQRAPTGGDSIFPPLGRRRPFGTEAKKGENGIPLILSSIFGLLWSAACLRSARNAVAIIRSALRVLSRESSVGQIVRRVHCVAVENAGIADVYCLTVPATGCFAIEGGLIVSNCGDEWRYACMSRPWIKKPIEDEKKPFDDYVDKDARDEYDSSSSILTL